MSRKGLLRRKGNGVCFRRFRCIHIITSRIKGGRHTSRVCCEPTKGKGPLKGGNRRGTLIEKSYPKGLRSVVPPSLRKGKEAVKGKGAPAFRYGVSAVAQRALLHNSKGPSQERLKGTMPHETEHIDVTDKRGRETMGTLVIVESPSKIKKVKQYMQRIVGPDIEVMASVGHIRDLPQKEMGVQAPEYWPSYEVSKDKRSVVSKLRAAAKGKSEIMIATDPDREGEAIGWHLMQVLGKSYNYSRVAFNEITHSAIEKALSQKSQVNMPMVMAQQGRRVLDRLVGYKVSGALIEKQGYGFTAGRVQSVAVKLVAERCASIDEFTPEDYMKVWAQIEKDQHCAKAWLHTDTFEAENGLFNDETVASDAASVRQLTVDAVDTKPVARKPMPALITSTLQQIASSKLGMNAKQTMYIAQKLYEAGHITYMRTDNPNLSDEAFDAISAFGAEKGYPMSDKKRTYKAKDGAQEGHEAIRASDVALEQIQVSLKSEKENEQAKALYHLIRVRAIASQCVDGEDDVTTVKLLGNGASGQSFSFGMKGCVVRRQGWRVLFSQEDATGDRSESEQEDNTAAIPPLSHGEQLSVTDSGIDKCKTKPPAYFTEASLIKKLEAEGVGRPSTYANIMDKIKQYAYVQEKKKKMHVTDKGKVLVSALDTRFAFMEVGYTKTVEASLDKVAEGDVQYSQLMGVVDDQINKELEAYGQIQKIESNEPTVECEKCGKPMRRIAKQSSKAFWGCSGYQDGCRHTMLDQNGKAVSWEAAKVQQQEQAKNESPCPKCNEGTMRKRKGKNGAFLGCTNYPACRHTEVAPTSSRRKKRNQKEGVAA